MIAMQVLPWLRDGETRPAASMVASNQLPRTPHERAASDGRNLAQPGGCGCPNLGMTFTLVPLTGGSQGAAMGTSPFTSNLRQILDWFKSTTGGGGDFGQTDPGDVSHLGHDHDGGGDGHGGGHGHWGGGDGSGHGHGGGGDGGGGHGH